jgi:hypothetical protein
LTLVVKSFIAINGFFLLAIVSCIVLTSSKSVEVLSRYNQLATDYLFLEKNFK